MIRKALIISLLGVGFGLGWVQAGELQRAERVQSWPNGRPPPLELAPEPLIYDHAAPTGPSLIPTRGHAPPTPAPLLDNDPLAAAPLDALPFETLSGPDDPASGRELLRQAAMSARLELRAGDMAMDQAQDEDTRAFALAAIEARRAALAEITALAAAKGYGVAGVTFDAWHAAQLTRFAREGASLERLTALIEDSRAKTQRYLAAYRDHGVDPELRAFAQAYAAAMAAQPPAQPQG